MRVLITGVAGFIGSNLADRLLREGYCVIGIDNLSCGVKEQIPDGVTFYQTDIRSPEIVPLFKNVDVVFHLAAKNCISDCQNEPVETCDINVTGSANVFDTARRAKVKRIIYAESSALYEKSTVFPTPEVEASPESFYAVSKLASMYLAKAFETFYDLQFTALRYFCVYGPRQDYRRSIPPVMSAFIIRLLKGKPPIIYGNGEKRRDFVYVDDVNDFHLLCMTDSRTDGKAFNIGSGVNNSVNEIYQKISDLLGIHISPIYQPDLPGEAEITLADITEAKRLGWEPKTDITTGVEQMIQYIRRGIDAGKIKG